MSCQVCCRLLCRCPMVPHTEAVDLASRLALTVAALRELVARCPCGGTGERREPYVAHLMSDDPRLPKRPTRGAEQARRAWLGSRVIYAVGVFPLVSACPECADLRQVIETAGGKS